MLIFQIHGEIVLWMNSLTKDAILCFLIYQRKFAGQKRGRVWGHKSNKRKKLPLLHYFNDSQDFDLFLNALKKIDSILYVYNQNNLTIKIQKTLSFVALLLWKYVTLSYHRRLELIKTLLDNIILQIFSQYFRKLYKTNTNFVILN